MGAEKEVRLHGLGEVGRMRATSQPQARGPRLLSQGPAPLCILPLLSLGLSFPHLYNGNSYPALQ